MCFLLQHLTTVYHKKKKKRKKIILKKSKQNRFIVNFADCDENIDRIFKTYSFLLKPEPDFVYPSPVTELKPDFGNLIIFLWRASQNQ